MPSSKLILAMENSASLIHAAARSIRNTMSMLHTRVRVKCLYCCSIYSGGRAKWPRLPDDFLDCTRLFPPGNLINTNKKWFPIRQK